MKCGLIGRGLKHSLSPQIHKELMFKNYELIDTEPEELESVLKGDTADFFSVTMPYKLEVMKYTQALSADAERIGSVNTVIRKGDGLHGYNTDIDGFKLCASAAGITIKGKKALVLGSGGASKAVTAALADEGAADIVIISRGGENNYDNISKHRDADIIINATPVGMFPYEAKSPVDLSVFDKLSGAIDLIYSPLKTKFIIQAESMGIPYANGLMMVIAQARTAEELYFERAIPESEVMRIYNLLNEQMTNIVLVGMPGCGKSSIGKELAEITGRKLIDTDTEIEKRTGIGIAEIFKKSGEAEFRKIERSIIAEAGSERGVIISTGGGAVKDASNYYPLHSNGIIYHIKRDISLLPVDGRPLSIGSDLKKLYAERLPMYKQFADFTIENDKTVSAAAEEIRRLHHENTCY